MNNSQHSSVSHKLCLFFKIFYCEMGSWKNLQKALLEFRNKRDWEQFHNPKDLALALSIEAAELNKYSFGRKLKMLM